MTLRVARSTYAILWVAVLILSVLPLLVLFSGRPWSATRDMAILGALQILVGVVGSAACARIELTISSRGISYRGVTYSTHIPRAEIVAVHVGMIKLQHGSSRVMIVKTLPDLGVQGLQIPIKLFGLDELRRFYETAEQLQIPIRRGAIRRRW